MIDLKLVEALIISAILSLLIFRTNYVSNLKISRQKYFRSGGKEYDYLLLITDLVTALLFSLIGCYLSWSMITTIPDFVDYLTWKFPISVLMGITFQQVLPIIIELVMNKINSFRPNK